MNRYFYDDPFGRPWRAGRPRRVRVPVRVEDETPTTEEQPMHEETIAKPTMSQEAMSDQTEFKTLTECQEALEKARAEAAEWKDRYLRLQADLENMRKRLERRYAAEAEREKERILQAMLPVADHLEFALRHASGRDEPLQQGVALTLKAFQDALAALDVRPIEAKDQPFDPNVHEAVGVEPTSAVEPGIVVAEEQKGYTYGDRVLRPARVRVSTSPDRASRIERDA
ncbi:MAG: nucleotide exchange factor GrpE [Chloroflexi bacterium]|nr:nucleotide exchange factor GrpE [Chloroflexota bacterium]